MSKMPPLAALLGVALCALALPVRAALPPEIEDPECLGINKQPAHATLMPYASLKEGLAANRHASSFCRSLNGPWKFHWVKTPDERPVDFYKPGYDVSAWKTIPVPSNWQVQGYGTPYYRNNGYTFQRDWPHVMTTPPRNFTAYEERNPVGSYRRDFEVPASWNGRRIFLTFDGVDSCFYLWVNGHKVGFSTNSRNAAEFDITPYVKPGRNMVAAEVYRYSAGSYLEDQDMWRLSGIFRNVNLWSSPALHVRDYFLKTDLDGAYRNATLLGTAWVRNFGAKPTPARTLTATVYDLQGRPLPGAKATASVPALKPGAEAKVSFKAPVANPKKWTAETPNLYTTVIALGNDTKSGEIISTRTGFRKIEIKGRLFTVNGVPIKLLGANRHEHWPDTGHYVSEARMIEDIKVLKKCNCNHVRTCHYSDDPRWYELCDEYGIYLTAEANVECHGYYNVLDREPKFEKAFVDRNVANVQNFKNHACIMMWSLGNECGGGSNLRAALKAIKAIDPEKPAHYEAFGTGPSNPADVDSQMYTTPASIAAMGADNRRTKPYYYCEYAHAMNNSMGSLAEYVAEMRRYPAILGGAIWEWQDQGLWNRRDPKHPYLAYGGGFGEYPNDHYFIHKGVVFSDRSPKPHYAEVKRAYQWIAIDAVDAAGGKIRVRNNYQFITLAGFKGHWTLSQDGKVIQQGTLPALNTAPFQSTEVTLPIKPFTPVAGREYFLSVGFDIARDQSWVKAGYQIADAQFPVPVTAVAPAADRQAPTVSLQEDDSSITVTGRGFAVAFDKSTGVLSSLKRDGIEILLPGGGPKLHLWRAPHRTDDDWAFRDWENFGLQDLQRKPLRVTATQDGPNVRVESIVQMTGKRGFAVTHSATYTVTGDGDIVVENAVVPSGPRIPLARIGVRMLIDKKLDQFAYLGRGPMENYPDRKYGFDVAEYACSVAQNMTPYAKPMECGNHEDVRWAAVYGNGTPSLVAKATDGLLSAAALPYTDEEMLPVEYTTFLDPSKATVFCLSAKTLGVGSNGCGPRPLDPYIVYSDPTTFSYLLSLGSATNRDFADQGRLTGWEPLGTTVKPALATRDRDGMVTLQSATQDATLEYSREGSTWTAYTAPFDMKEAATLFLRATGKSGGAFVSAVTLTPYDQRVKWRILGSSSYEPGEGDAIHAIDGNADSFWHSRYSDPAGHAPHWLAVDFVDPLNVAAIHYVARRDMENGHVKDYEVYLSLDGKEWGTPVAKGTFNNAPTQTIRLAQPVKARYMKFVALSEQRNADYATIAELSVTPAK